MKRLLIPLLCLLALSARADNPAQAPSPAPITPEERQQLLDQAKSLKAEFSKQKEAAEKKHKAADADCWKKTLVSGCMRDAKREYLDSMAAARKLDVEAKRIERQVRERDRVTKRIQQAEEAPVKQAERERKIAREKAKTAEQQAKRGEKEVVRQRKAEEGSARARISEKQRQDKIESRRKKEEKAEEKALEREKKDRKRAEEKARQLEHAQQQGM